MKTLLHLARTQLRLLIGSSALVVVLALVGLLALAVARLVPDAPVVRHVAQSVPTFVAEGDWPLSLCSRLDNYMDSMTLNIASDEGGGGLVECALKNPFWVAEGVSEGVGSLAARFARDGASDGRLRRAKYVRYWFGSVAVVRPLMALLDYPRCRFLNTVLVFACAAVLLGLLKAAGRLRYAPAFLVAFALMDPLAIGKSIQFSPCFYLSLLPAIAWLALRKTSWLESPARQALFFAGVGALTSYFDLLTYPILTFALPMAVGLLAQDDDESAAVSSDIGRVLVCLAHWFLGFVLMWFLKWALVTALTDVNAFYEVFRKFAERSGTTAADGLKISRLHAVRVNFLDFLPYLNAWLAGGFVLALAALYRGGAALFRRRLPVFLVAALPPAWMFMTANHAYIHHFFVSKGLAASVFVFLCWLTDALAAKGRAAR